MRLRTGRDMTVVDVSDGGALAESSARLLPGTHVDVHVTTLEGRALVRSRVVRAYVCHVQSDEVRYRGALAFDRRVDTSLHGYTVPGAGAEQRGAPGTSYPDPGVTEGDRIQEALS
jgi:hypothetical protein